jgi:hypothetical protein
MYFYITKFVIRGIENIIKFVNNERYVFILYNELKTILIDKSEK